MNGFTLLIGSAVIFLSFCWCFAFRVDAPLLGKPGALNDIGDQKSTSSQKASRYTQ